MSEVISNKFPISSLLLNKPVSQSCAVVKNEIFRWATGQSNLADRMADRMADSFIGESASV